MRFVFVTLSFFVLVTSLPSRQAFAETTEQEIQSVSEQLKGTPARGVQKLLPDISVIGVFSGAYFSVDPVAGTTGVDPARTGINLQEIETAFQSVIDPYLRADLILSFGEASVELEEGYVTTLGLPRNLQVRGGKFRLPFGRQNVKHLEFLDFADNTLVNKYLLGPDGLKELGVEVSYLVPIPFFLQLQGTFSNGDNGTSFDKMRRQDFLYQGRLTTSVDTSENMSVLIGASGAFGFNKSFPGAQTKTFGGDFLLKWKPKSYRGVVWQSEYLFRSLEDAPGSHKKDGGFYSYVDYQFLKRWHAGFRYDQVGVPTQAITREFRVTPALTFNPTEFSRIRVQYEYDKVNNANAAHAAFLQLKFSMGPHGAHSF